MWVSPSHPALRVHMLEHLHASGTYSHKILLPGSSKSHRGFQPQHRPLVKQLIAAIQGFKGNFSWEWSFPRNCSKSKTVKLCWEQNQAGRPRQRSWFLKRRGRGAGDWWGFGAQKIIPRFPVCQLKWFTGAVPENSPRAFTIKQILSWISLNMHIVCFPESCLDQDEKTRNWELEQQSLPK